MLVENVPISIGRYIGPMMRQCKTCLYYCRNCSCCDHLALTGRPRKRKPGLHLLRKYLEATGGRMPPPNCGSWERYDAAKLRRLAAALRGIPTIAGK